MIALTPEQMARAKALLAEGKTWGVIAKLVGSTYFTVRCELDPSYRSRRAAQIREARARKPPSTKAVTLEEAQRAIAAIPDDTRALTARLLGDPLPGRSALDRRGA
jgi:hypothetical protein